MSSVRAAPTATALPWYVLKFTCDCKRAPGIMYLFSSPVYYREGNKAKSLLDYRIARTIATIFSYTPILVRIFIIYYAHNSIGVYKFCMKKHPFSLLYRAVLSTRALATQGGGGGVGGVYSTQFPTRAARKPFLHGHCVNTGAVRVMRWKCRCSTSLQTTNNTTMLIGAVLWGIYRCLHRLELH
jgi:hypothetical protein